MMNIMNTRSLPTNYFLFRNYPSGNPNCHWLSLKPSSPWTHSSTLSWLWK